MIVCSVLALILQASSAGDYFPLKPGTVYTYEQKGKDVQMSKIVGTPLDMGGVAVTPVTDRQIGGGGTTTYYRIDPDQVLIVAYDIKHPLPTPMPLFKLGTGKLTWDFAGSTKTGVEGERLLARGDVHPIGKREVLGKKVDAIEVRIQAQVGIGMSAEIFDQKAIYAKGFGLVEWTSKMTLGNNRKKADQSAYKLVDMQEAKAGG
ncbi:MAG: hypothetical protein P4L46_05700 [Fimbriimonas sp.]|nr:hypothetical protein [Fimbriimonas sp.]